MDLEEFTISRSILGNVPAQSNNRSALETLPNEILTNVLRHATVIDQICFGLCNKQLGAIVMAMRILKPIFPNSDAAAIRKDADDWNADFYEEEVEDEDGDGDDDSEEDVEGDSDDESEDEYAAGNGDRFPKLSKAQEVADYKIHRKKGTAKLELLRRLLTWAPRSMGICQWCVKYKLQSRKYWSNWKSFKKELCAFSEFHAAVVEELRDDCPQCEFHEEFPKLEGLIRRLEKELCLGCLPNLVSRWSENSRGYETVACFINKHVKNGTLLMACNRDYEKSVVLTIRKTPNRCPTCSLDEAERLVPTSSRDDILDKLSALQELRTQIFDMFQNLLEDASKLEL